MTNDLDSGSAEHVVLFIAESLRRRDDDTVTSVNAERVEVFHVADGDTVVSGIADDLIFGLLPALERLFNENLRRQSQRAGRQVAKLLSVLSKTTAETTKSVCSADDNRVSNSLSGGERLVDSVDSDTLGDRDVDLLECLSEEVTVLTDLECPDACSQNLDVVTVEDAHLVHLHTQVQRSLATEGQEDAVGAFLFDNIGDVFRSDREIVDFICKHVCSLNGSDVGVDENGLDASLFQGLECLRTRVIELAGLSNGETTGANDKDFFHIDEVLGAGNGTAFEVCFGVGSGLGLAGRLPSGPGEAPEVLGSSIGLLLLPDATRHLRDKGAAGNARSGLAGLVEQLLLQLARQLAAKSHGCVWLSICVSSGVVAKQ